MKKNLLFLTLSIVTSFHLTAAEYEDYPYALTEDTTILIPYETDAHAEGVSFGYGISTRNPEHIFEETKILLEASKTPQSKATRYYLSKRFQDLQDNPGRYLQTMYFRYIHAINALRNDLHSQENIRRMVNALEQREDLSNAQKFSASAIEKDMFSLAQNPQSEFRPRILGKIKTLIKMSYPRALALPVVTYAAAGAAAVQTIAVPTIRVQEEVMPKQAKEPKDTKRKFAPSASLPAAAARPTTPTATEKRGRVTFNPEVEKTRFQTTRQELTVMHGSSLNLQKAKEAEARGIIVRAESPIGERMQQGSLAALNDMPPFPPCD